jgi:hypothetical protein
LNSVFFRDATFVLYNCSGHCYWEVRIKTGTDDITGA